MGTVSFITSSTTPALPDYVYTWGVNTHGETAHGDRITRSSPVQVGFSADWVSMVTSQYATVFLDVNNNLYTCGYNLYGETGLGISGNAGSRSFPTQVGTSEWNFISSGFNSLFAIKTDGTLWGWGRNFRGELGLGDKNIRSSPTQIGSDSDWAYIEGEFQAIAIKTNGTLWSWGYNSTGGLGLGDNTERLTPVQVGSDTDWYSVSAGAAFNMCLKTDGSLWAFGSNIYGQLGIGDIANRSSPVQVGTDTDWSELGLANATVGAIRSDGTLWMWGRDNYGQLPQPYYSGGNRSSPVQIGSDTNWQHIRGAYFAFYALKTDGTIWSWGRGDSGQLGHNDDEYLSSPTQIGSETYWSNICKNNWGNIFGTMSNYSITTGLYGLGDNGSSQFNDRNEIGNDFYSPTLIGDASDWQTGIVGLYSGMLIKPDGTLWASGRNTSGELGLGDIISRSSPTQVGSDTWTYAITSQYGSFAVNTDGSLWGWGPNTFSNLGLGDSTPRSTPTQVGTDTNWDYVGVDYRGLYTLGLKTDGSLWAWGYNAQGQLGLGDGTARTTPEQVGSLTDWVQLNVGYNSCLALKDDGTMWTWGQNSYGQMGIDGGGIVNSPVQSGSELWSYVSMGYYTSGGIKTDGTLWMWGRNTYGQLGLGTADSSTTNSSPTQVGADTDWESVCAAGYTCYAIKTDGSLWAWGDNGEGQLGQGDQINRSSPVQVGFAENWTYVYSFSNTSNTSTVCIRE